MSIKLDTYGGVKNFFHFDQCFDLFHRILQIRGKNIFKNTKPHHPHLKMHVDKLLSDFSSILVVSVRT